MNKAAASDLDAKIQRGFYITVGCVIALPILIYGIFTKQYPTDPDFIYVPAPNLFAAKWEKVGESETFSQYLNKSKIIKNNDQTISVLVMRNFSSSKSKKDSFSTKPYRSEVASIEIDCFHKTFETTKIYLITGSFANGPLAEEPQEIFANPLPAKSGSVGLQLIDSACTAVNYSNPAKPSRINFMQDI